ncbi:hypothetical protein [Aurantibacter crassamenti]|nr:hypothetical protein [Aurantibacter crassamenti]
MISKLILPLVAWDLGIWLIVLFAVVCVLLVVAVLSMMSNGKKKE